MCNPELEQKFLDYRQYLEYEAGRLVSYAALYRRLHERRSDRIEEMNIAPAFFSVTADALFSAIVLWTDKLFDEHAERGIFNFLSFIEYNIKSFAIDQLKRRRNYPDEHWMLDREPITLQVINDHREKIRELSCLESFKIRRDKFYAHFDKGYFFNRKRFADEAPLKWGDLDSVTELLKDIINHYSAAYDGQLFELKPMNINDVDYLLDRLRKGKKSGCS